LFNPPGQIAGKSGRICLLCVPVLFPALSHTFQIGFCLLPVRKIIKNCSMNLLKRKRGITEDDLLRACPLQIVPDNRFDIHPGPCDANGIPANEFKIIL